MEELLLKEKMKQEALKRLELLNASATSRERLLNNWQITKCLVDFNNKTLKDKELTDEERQYITDFENRYQGIVYYVIQDEGMWPDGSIFERYTLLYVSKYENEWQMEKEGCIKKYKTVPAYVINKEEFKYSELAEIGYAEVAGYIMNVT